MNPDEIKQIVGIAITVLSPYLAQYGLTPGIMQNALTAVGTLAGVGYLVYSHWNKVKVPETAKVVSQ